MTKSKKEKRTEMGKYEFIEFEELNLDESDADFFSDQILESEETLREEDPKSEDEPQVEAVPDAELDRVEDQPNPVSMQTSAKLGKILANEKKAGTRKYFPGRTRY